MPLPPSGPICWRCWNSLAPETWSRTATVTGAGKPFVHTVHSYAQRLAIHERPHVKQIERAIITIAR